MKTSANYLIIFLFILLFTNQSIAQQDPFIGIWHTHSDSNFVVIPTHPAYDYLYDVQWEYLQDTSVNGEVLDLTGQGVISFPQPGSYRLAISGDFPAIYFYATYQQYPLTGSKGSLGTVEQWGDIAWETMDSAFYDEYIVIEATDTPDLSLVTSMDAMFYSSGYLGGENVANWNTSNVTSMKQMFKNASGAVYGIGAWDVSKVTNMQEMLYRANYGIDDITGWDVSSVTDMIGMFQYSYKFDQDIGNWNVGNVRDMSRMFHHAQSFNQDIGGWDVSNVESMSEMFFSGSTFYLGYNQYLFNQNIDNWNVINVSDMSRMFYSADSFNQSIGTWDVANVTNMSEMFYGTNAFNQDINSWDVSNVTDMSSMFASAASFNQDLNALNTVNVVDMSFMFAHNIAFQGSINNLEIGSVQNMNGMFWDSKFNQYIGDWDVSSVTDMSYMFSDNFHFNQDIGNWDVGNVLDMSYMFANSEDYQQSTAFNQDIGDWDVSNVINMHAMFRISSFDQDIGGWDVSSVTDMAVMFTGDFLRGQFFITPFNQDIGTWDVSSVTTMGGMFELSAFNQDISGWDVSNVTSMGSMFAGFYSFTFDSVLYAQPFNQDIGAWDISNISGIYEMYRMFDASSMDICNYDATLIGWAEKNVQPNIQLGAQELLYHQAQAARQELIDGHGWTFIGDSLSDQPCQLLTITGITFEDSTFLYDGTEKTLLISGTPPAGATVTYLSNVRTEAGSQQATVTISAPGYQSLTLLAMLEILPAPITGIAFEDSTFVYDGTEKTLLVSGTPPSDVIVTYENNTRTEPGSQIAVALLTGTNYDTLTLYAILNIDQAANDADCDGVPDELDVCPGGEDTIDNNGDGLPDCIEYPGYEYLPESWTCSPNPSNEKVYICHNHHTICVSVNAIPAHLAHEGDYLGPCDAANCGNNNRLAHADDGSSKSARVIAYPNPASGHIVFHIEGDVVACDRLEIFDLMGHQHLSLLLRADQVLCDLDLDQHQIGDGMYVVRVRSSTPRQTSLLLIKR